MPIIAIFPKLLGMCIEKRGQVVYNSQTRGEEWGKVGETVRMFYFHTPAIVSADHVPGRVRTQLGRQGSPGHPLALSRGAWRGRGRHTWVRSLPDGFPTLGLGEAGPALFELITNSLSQSDVRVAALAALKEIKSSNFAEALEYSSNSEVQPLRQEAIRLK